MSIERPFSSRAYVPSTQDLRQKALETSDLRPLSARVYETLEDPEILEAPGEDRLAISAPVTPSGSAAWGAITGTLSSQTDLQTALNGKAAASHTHPQSDITNLVTDLSNKQPLDSDLTAIAALITHSFGRALLEKSDANSVRTYLDAAWSGHGHAQADITGLVSALAGKASTSHTHAISDVTSLQTTLDAKQVRRVVDVKHYGATGDGTTDDTASINSAIAALTNNSCLYFPPGKYNHTGVSVFANLTNVLILGDGAQLYQNTNANNSMEFANSCSYITVQGLWFNGVGSARANGIHLRIYCNHCTVRNCRFERCSDWAIQVDNSGGAAVKGFRCIDNLFIDTLGDGVHVMNVDGFLIQNNVFWECGDDAIAALAQSTTVRPINGLIDGNYIYGRTANLAGADTTGFRGIVVFIGKRITVSNNVIQRTRGAAVEIGDEYNSSLDNEEILVTGNLCFDNCIASGPLAAILFYWCTRGTVSNNTVLNPSTGSCIAIGDVNQVDVCDNNLTQTLNQSCRGITVNTGTYSGRIFGTSSSVAVCNNRIRMEQANNLECLYLTFASGGACTNLIVNANTCFSYTTYYINGNYWTTAKVTNNTSIGGTSIATGANSTSVTTVNNN